MPAKLSRFKWPAGLLIMLFSSGMVCGCARHQERPMITAVGLSPSNRCDPPGIPYYLPKPLLVVAKNVRHIDESKVGLTAPVPIPGGFDNQAAYGDIKANVTVPSGDGKQAVAGDGATLSSASLTGVVTQDFVAETIIPSGAVDDGIEPDSFFTYQVIFVPDLSQKYGLQISGGAGEFRAAMNMVNGWMYTGAGPFYMKDSSSAQNAMATGVAAMFAGRGAADVIEQVGGLTQAIGSLPRNESTTGQDISRLATAFEAFTQATNQAPRVAREMLNYAEVYIYEPVLLPDNSTDWRLVTEHHFDRHYFDREGEAMTADQKSTLLQSFLQAAGAENQPSSIPASQGGGQKESARGGGSGASETVDPLDRALKALERMPAGGQLNITSPTNLSSPANSPNGTTPLPQSNQDSNGTPVQINIDLSQDDPAASKSQIPSLGSLLRSHRETTPKRQYFSGPSAVAQ